jgi:hypothetical protein
VAIVNQGRSLAGKTPLANAQAALYAMPSADFHDIVDGDNQFFDARAGYDLASGLGSPIADRLIPDMVAFNGSTDFTVGLPPVAGLGKKSQHHFSPGVDVARVPIASISLSSGGHGLHHLFASSFATADAAYAQHETFAQVDTVPVVASNGAATPASSKSRLSSARRELKSGDKPVRDVANDIDAFFDGLGEGVAAA